MSADLWIKISPRASNADEEKTRAPKLNVTYNLSGMLREAGFNGWDWCRGKPAPQVGAHMLAVLDGMATDPDRWRAMNPPNGMAMKDLANPETDHG